MLKFINYYILKKLECHITCLECVLSNTSTNCKTCDAAEFRILINGNSCLCDFGYYDDGTNICASK